MTGKTRRLDLKSKETKRKVVSRFGRYGALGLVVGVGIALVTSLTGFIKRVG
ncbi:hypothetical protein [Sphingobacterium corticis]|uniref:hypothetical protein n=1 Tax=Sphingobacterium corticis TaxID=1812823 RepID=UPI0036D39AC2